MKISKKIQMILFFKLCLHYTLINSSNDDERKPYIVYMGDIPEHSTYVVDKHHNLLSEAIGDARMATEHKIHSYGRSFNGFVARLLPHEAKILSQKEGVLSVFPNTMLKLHTTRSWDFLGMSEGITKRNLKLESNLIIGVLDTGIWLESPSFNDKGYGPPPRKWKGKCATGENFTRCNNKVIGAQYFNLDDAPFPPSPVDTDGHGTHTASTAAGVAVNGASLYGLANGTARGGVSSARIAMYKVCWGIGCTDMDLLAGLDAAIADGVDVLSISIGGPSRKFFEDPMAIGAFHAWKKGIVTSCSGGNSGPDIFTIENVAPWILTVGASSIDRQFQTSIKLGNGMIATGISINTFSPKMQMYPLISGALAANRSNERYGNASLCDYETLSEEKVKGKIVYCISSQGQDSTIQGYSGAGTIMTDDGLNKDTPSTFIIPATTIDPKDGENIDRYITSTKSAKAVIYKSEAVRMDAPFITSFSSRGPQLVSLNILKPDVVAPGLSILAAYSGLTTVTGINNDDRYAKYNIISGTSMACPHVAAAAAYVKSFHPKWSATAIKSALMTTAKPMKIKPMEAELASGSGQINPINAVHPGLIYDINLSSYIRYFCKEGYNTTAIRLLTGGKKDYNCTTFPPARGADGLNYPSMHIQLKNRNSTISAVFYRTVTHVGYKKSAYHAKVTSPKGLFVKVFPKIMIFDRPYQKRNFVVVVKGKFIKEESWLLSALLVWRDAKHRVRSPILVYRSLS